MAQEYLDLLMQRDLPTKLGKPDWTYRDLPVISHDAMELFKFNIGEENLLWLTVADYGKRGCRGQVLISPEGMKRIEAIAKDESAIVDPPGQGETHH